MARKTVHFANPSDVRARNIEMVFRDLSLCDHIDVMGTLCLGRGQVGGIPFPVVTAVVLGGTSLVGGQGTTLCTLLRALTIAVIGIGLILMHVSPFLTQIVTGTIILLAICLNTWICTGNFRFDKKRTRT